MELEIGAILEGKVTGITKFGAFVALPGGRSGLVHISEIAYSYVSDVSEFLQVGQDVKVKLISVDDNGRINLSIKKTTPPPPRPQQPGGRPAGGRPPMGSRPNYNSRPRPQFQSSPAEGSAPTAPAPAPAPSAPAPRTAPPAPQSRNQFRSQEPQSFDDMLKHFLSDSESRQSDLNRGGESRRPRRNRRG
ncbi:MAG: S1 RNA-binding domain-containing protein [Oscillospiraceae bacterium]|nr:S1 RNA-binding domain-containing protein [Oscillospiraceae bacterium]